ncbi:MAG: YceI family protein [Acidobacteria bacterium]|nr:YceI family protein [Acidobacteriota bacterium]
MTRVFVLATLAATLAAETLTVAPAQGARFGLEVYKTGLLSGKVHVFTFERYQGTVEYDARNPAATKVDVTFEAASLKCHDDWSPAKGSLGKIMKEALDVALQSGKHPRVEFQSTAVKPGAAAGQFDVQGTLTIRGQAKPVTATLTVKPEPRGLEVDGESSFKMTDYGIKPPSAALGTIGTKPEIIVAFRLLAQR